MLLPLFAFWKHSKQRFQHKYAYAITWRYSELKTIALSFDKIVSSIKSNENLYHDISYKMHTIDIIFILDMFIRLVLQPIQYQCHWHCCWNRRTLAIKKNKNAKRFAIEWHALICTAYKFHVIMNVLSSLFNRNANAAGRYGFRTQVMWQFNKNVRNYSNVQSTMIKGENKNNIFHSPCERTKRIEYNWIVEN